MSLIAHASCPSCPSCSAKVDLLTDEEGYLIGNLFVCDGCGSMWVEMCEQLESLGTGHHRTSESIEKGARS